MGHITMTTGSWWLFIYLTRLDITYMCTKFNSSSLSHSLDMDGGGPKFTRGSAMAEGLHDVLVSRNSATTKHLI